MLRFFRISVVYLCTLSTVTLCMQMRVYAQVYTIRKRNQRAMQHNNGYVGAPTPVATNVPLAQQADIPLRIHNAQTPQEQTPHHAS